MKKKILSSLIYVITLALAVLFIVLGSKIEGLKSEYSINITEQVSQDLVE